VNIVVCIKQVPDVDDIKWTKENNLDRSSMLSKLNPYDEWALDYALKIKKQFSNVGVIAISMGPNQAAEVLEYALAKGATRAILLSDKAFAGSDTLATSLILSKAIKKFVPDFHLILTGQVAQDGDTAQTPVEIAQHLLIPDIINTIEIYNADTNFVIASQKLESRINTYKLTTPCLVAVSKEAPEHYVPRIDDYIRAQNTKIEVYGIEDIDLTREQVGVIGSPTWVQRAYRPNAQKDTQEIFENKAQIVLDFMLRVN